MAFGRRDRLALDFRFSAKLDRRYLLAWFYSVNVFIFVKAIQMSEALNAFRELLKYGAHFPSPRNVADAGTLFRFAKGRDYFILSDKDRDAIITALTPKEDEVT